LRDERYLEHDSQDLIAEPHFAGRTFRAYTLVRSLGAGGMGSVWLARRYDGGDQAPLRRAPKCNTATADLDEFVAEIGKRVVD
jgi:hypothetical protein